MRAMVDFIVAPPQHRRRGQLPHPQRRDPAADGHAERRRHDARGPVDLQAPVGRSAPSSPATRRSASSTTSSTTPRRSSPAPRTGSTSTSGALFWTVEIWAPNKEAGITDYQWIDWYREHPVEDDLKLLKWSDEQCGGQAHVDWYPFRHPQLGMVELGGWDKMNYWRNPPPRAARARGGALPGLADAARAVAAAGWRCCAPRCARSAPTPGACASRWPTPATCRPT
ncbi:MAG: hypothetical protein MZW92_04595 [Comamonadaceae bacterium]|nr:hypothetical protein [Comamonadaceae bacterium]